MLYIVWSVGALDIDWHRVDQGMTRAANMFARMVPPDFSRWQLLASGLIESVQMALAASFIGMLLAIPLGVCAAGNLVPKPVYLAARAVLVVSRTFHEVIIAIFFGANLTGASLNPARTIGPDVVKGDFSDIWIYIVGPILGGILAALLYKYLLKPADEEVASE